MRDKLAALVCKATQKTNYKCDTICSEKGRCVYCLVIAEELLAGGGGVQERNSSDPCDFEVGLSMSKSLYEEYASEAHSGRTVDLDAHFVEGIHPGDDYLEILNWYRNLYHAENPDTERGIMARVINDLFMDMKQCKAEERFHLKTQERECLMAENKETALKRLLEKHYFEIHAIYDTDGNQTHLGDCYCAAVDLLAPGLTFRIYFKEDENGKIEVKHAERWYFG